MENQKNKSNDEQSLLPNKRLNLESNASANDPNKRKKTIMLPITQHQLIEKIKQKAQGSTCVMVSKNWYNRWEAYCLDLNNSYSPGPIDNLDLLLDDEKTVKPDLVKDIHYFALPVIAFKHYQSWYGLKNPSHLIEIPSAIQTEEKKHASRVVIKKSKSEKQLLKFRIYIVGSLTNKCHKLTMSPNSTAYDFHNMLVDHVMKIPPSTLDLWVLNKKNSHLMRKLNNSSYPFTMTEKLLSNRFDSSRFAQKIDLSAISFDSTIASCLDSVCPKTPEEDDVYYLAVKASNNNNNNKDKSTPIFLSMATTSTTANKKSIRGLRGLQNLGNTCYMNSAIQCLSNIPQLTRWFLSGKYVNDLNTSNPLGLNGKLAEAYALLLRDIWKPDSSLISATTSRIASISPKEFKSTFERFNPHFVGFHQQDSQELLSFLLDGLHEDLNRVKEKPYIEIPDFDDTLSDVEIANRFWEYHKMRNDSVIVDLFQGQYKSRLTCNECKKVSITFDPFMYLSLPLPMDTKWEINVVYVPYLPSQKQLKMKIHLNKDANVKNFKKHVMENVLFVHASYKLDHNHLLVVEIQEGKINKVFRDDDLLAAEENEDSMNLYVYQLPETNNLRDRVIFPVHCFVTTRNDEQQNGSPQQEMFGHPIILAVEAYKFKNFYDLYAEIIYHLQRYCCSNTDLLYERECDKPYDIIDQDRGIETYHAHTDTSTMSEPPNMVPVLNLFNIHLFECSDISSGATDDEDFIFPALGCHSINWVQYDSIVDAPIIKQGQGVFIEWEPSIAERVFGAISSPNIQNDTNALNIDTRAWFDYDELPSIGEKQEPAMITLEDCLNEFTNDEQLGNKDSWYCPRCKKHQRASKKIDIWKLPEIMVVHLKRFSQVRRWRNKVDTFIDFPLTKLDMSNCVLGNRDGQNLIYDLCAVDNHYGGMGGGHYTTFAKNIETSNWYEFNDTHVDKISSESVKTKAAYLLFYKKRSSVMNQ
ncbi:MAG: hypothetical protein EXX96DRAFT_615041 [Benjaminiella poitrasii]|nr:MAG: hypothetical protein EXX96DRAFT_615041 [Benjaminiella poitrasii]